jgi:hypothetical protein
VFCTPFLIALGAFNRALTGSVLRFPQDAYFDEHVAPENVPFFTYGRGCNRLGFGAACDHTVRDATHTLSSALSDAGDNLRAWAVLLAGPIILAGVGFGLTKRTGRRPTLWLVLPSFFAILLYGLYWQAGVCYGARFYHAAVPSLVVAAASGLATQRLRSLALAAGLALLLDGGGFAVALHEITAWSWWGTDARFATLASHWRGGPAVVMVAFGRDDVRSPALFATGAQSGDGTWLLGVRALAALGQNAPAVSEGQIVFAKFQPALVSDLATRFPDRKLWLYTAWADPSKDAIEPWTASSFTTHTYRKPADNFDGFRVGPPYTPADPLLREPSDEGWPP